MSLVNQAENQDNQRSKVFKSTWEVDDIGCKVGVAPPWLLIPLYIPHYPKHHTATTYFLHQAPHPLIILHLVTNAPSTSAFHYTAPTYITSCEGQPPRPIEDRQDKGLQEVQTDQRNTLSCHRMMPKRQPSFSFAKEAHHFMLSSFAIKWH